MTQGPAHSRAALRYFEARSESHMDKSKLRSAGCGLLAPDGPAWRPGTPDRNIPVAGVLPANGLGRGAPDSRARLR